MRRRWNEHQSKLRHGVHPNHSLQTDWNQDGAAVFVFEVLFRVDSQEQLLTAEESHILRTANPYNQNERGGTGPRAGYRHTQQARERMSKACMGKKKPEGFRELMSRIRRGVRHSLAHRQAIGAARRGRKDSPETKAKRVASYKLAVARRHAAQVISSGELG